MTDPDWALVVGIAKYPTFGNTSAEPNDLRGPINDAVAVADVLKNVLGVQNITLLTSDKNNGTDWADPPRPVVDDIDRWFMKIIRQSDANVAAGKEPKVGRRLYVYLSGHGLAPEKSKRALVSSDALAKTYVKHFLATTWHDRLINSRFFAEYVLFMDCCTQARVTLIPSDPPFELKPILVPQPPQVVGCAAKFGEMAVELPLGPNGEFHGVFTFELVRGLRGAAANPKTGGIRTGDLLGYLYQAVPQHIDKLPEKDRTGVSREPDFIEDDDIEFVAPQQVVASAKARKITFTNKDGPIPGDGTLVQILDHERHPEGAPVAVVGGELAVTLAPGFYKLEWTGGKRLIDVADDGAIDA
jgi:hypothetical protein